MTKQLITLTEPRSPAAEAFRSLYINLSFSQQERALRSLVVTSPGPGEGKSITLANLAVVAAQMGQRVILVDGDLRQPQLNELFGLRNDTGLTNVVDGSSSTESALQAVAEVPGLRVLTSGPLPPSPTTVLASRRMGELADELAEQADLLLLDAPPVLTVSDASVLASRVNGVLLVLNAGQTKRENARRAKEALEKVNAHIVGVVLTNVAPDAVLQGNYK
jgi:non-specific protein-tyrosine kinase